MLETILIGAIAGGTSILFAALGETISERGGAINVGTEGTMLVGCLAGVAADVQTGSPWVGALAGIAAGALLACVFAYVTVWRQGNQLAAGLALMFLALGITALFGTGYVSANVHALSAWKVPGLGHIPAIGKDLLRPGRARLRLLLHGPGVWWFLFRSRWGLLIRTAGERPETLLAYGVSATRVRATAIVIGGGLAGLGGAELALGLAQSWSEGMTAGRGFIAVSLVIFGAWRPVRVMLGAWLFGAAITLGSTFEAHGVNVNQFALNALPYVLTLVVLVALARRQRGAAPEALGQPI